MNPCMRSHISFGFSSVLAKLASKGSLSGMSITHMGRQSGWGGAGHITCWTLILVHMAPHVVSQEPFHRKGFATCFARILQLSNVLLPDMVQKFGSVGEKASTGGTGNQLLLTVTTHVLAQL